jgi:hypothetical protein
MSSGNDENRANDIKPGVDLDEWDAGFRQTKSKTPVPTHYELSIHLRGVFWKDLQGRRLASYRLWC